MHPIETTSAVLRICECCTNFDMSGELVIEFHVQVALSSWIPRKSVPSSPSAEARARKKIGLGEVRVRNELAQKNQIL